MRSLRQNLAIFGSIAAFTGILSFALFGAPAFWSDDLWKLAVQPTAVYVGSGGCLTCHLDDYGGWTSSPQRDLAHLQVENPHAIASSLDLLTAAVRTEDRSSRLSEAAPDSQLYMILTDSGYSPLPGGWDIGDHPIVMGSSAPLESSPCTDCHLFRREPPLDKSTRSSVSSGSEEEMLP